jgi:hypothetical protein
LKIQLRQLEGIKSIRRDRRSLPAFFLSLKVKQDFTRRKYFSNSASSFKPGNPPDGQQMLKDAFTSYFEARKQTDEN